MPANPFWWLVSGIIVVLLSANAFLLKTGIAGLRRELTKIWEKLDTNHEETNRLHLRIERVEAKCEERHKPYPHDGVPH